VRKQTRQPKTCTSILKVQKLKYLLLLHHVIVAIVVAAAKPSTTHPLSIVATLFGRKKREINTMSLVGGLF